MTWTNLWKKYSPFAESKPVDLNLNKPLEGLVNLWDLPPSTLLSLEFLLRPKYPLANLLQKEVDRLRKAAVGLIRVAPRGLEDLVSREQALGAFDQVDHFENFFAALHSQVLAEIKKQSKDKHNTQ